MKSSIQQFRWVAIAEGWSFLILLFIAMPLKYVFDLPQAVKIVGWLHGVLFVAFGFLMLNVAVANDWKITKILVVFLSGFVPFGTFWMEKKYLR